MTNLKEKLQAERTAFWKAGKTLEKDTLGLVLGSIQTAEKSGKTVKVFTDKEVIDFLAGEVKKRRDTAKTYADAGINDRAERETAEADFLATYLPAQLTEEAIEDFVNTAVAQNPDANLGQIMKLVVPFTKGRADGAVVRRIVQEKIA